MRKVFYFFGVFSVIFFSACSDDPPSPEEQAIKDRQRLLESTIWEAVRVTSNDEPVYSYYNFTLEIEGDLMTTNDQYRVFPTTRWHFVDMNPDLIYREKDGVEMTLSDVSDTTLTLSFTLDQSFDNPGGREELLAGDYIFIMAPLD